MSQVKDGFMKLIVPVGQNPTAPGPISCAEVVTDFAVKYASVRTYAVLTDEPGVCNGIFVYANDNQESDIEWISDPNSHVNIDANNGTRAILYTNQDTTGIGESTTASGRALGDATSQVHEYRLDWTVDATKYYLDGFLQYTFTQNVPSEAGPWIWNNWVNSDPYWTVGPPVTTAVFKIQKIVIYNS